MSDYWIGVCHRLNIMSIWVLIVSVIAAIGFIYASATTFVEPLTEEEEKIKHTIISIIKYLLYIIIICIFIIIFVPTAG